MFKKSLCKVFVALMVLGTSGVSFAENVEGDEGAGVRITPNTDCHREFADSWEACIKCVDLRYNACRESAWDYRFKYRLILLSCSLDYQVGRIQCDQNAHYEPPSRPFQSQSSASQSSDGEEGDTVYLTE